MLYVFNRHYVRNGKTYTLGQTVADTEFTGEQFDTLMLIGFVQKVVQKEEMLATPPAAYEYEEVDIDPVEALDPERKSTRKGKK